MATSIGKMLVVFLAVLAAFDPVKSTTHWVVTEDGMITQQLDSAFNMKEPYSLIAVMDQEKRAEEVMQLRQDLERHKREIEANEDDTDMEEKFLRSDPDCVEAGRPLTEFELYVSTAISLENKGISVTDYLNTRVNESKKFSRPNCTRVFDLPFSMHAYDHLPSVQESHNLSNHPEPELSYLLPQQDTLENIGHLLHKALAKNKTSWVLYDIAGYYWRIRGNSKEVIECSRRALHFSRQQDKNVALLNMANVVHRSHRSLDAAILVQGAMESGEDLDVLYFMLGNVLAEKGDYNKSAACFAETAERNPDLGAAHSRKHAVLCHQKLKAALEAQHISVQKALVELQDYQRKQQHFHEVEQRVLSSQKKPDEQFEANLSYQRQRFLQEMGENPHCEVSELGSGAQFLMCRREAITESGIFGIPADEDKEIEISDTSLIHENCVSAGHGTAPSVTCFNVTAKVRKLPCNVCRREPSPPPAHEPEDDTPLWARESWPSLAECQTIGSQLPDWKRMGQIYRLPRGETDSMKKVMTRPFSQIIDSPVGQPFCTDADIMNGRETAMDFVEGISQRDQLPSSGLRKDLKIVLKPYCNIEDIRIREFGKRIAAAIKELKHGTSQWVAYNLAALYWREMDNTAQAINCLRPALVFAPVEEAGVPLTNTALLMMSIGRPHDALQLLRMALVVNNSEPFIHYSLGNAWMALTSYDQAALEYIAALNLDPDLAEAKEALGRLKCYMKSTSNGGPKHSSEDGKEGSHGTIDGNIQQESRTVCYQVDGEESCQVEVLDEKYLPESDGDHRCSHEGSAGQEGDPRCQVTIQGPPKVEGKGASQTLVKKDNKASSKSITVNVRKIPSSGTIPSSAYGPHIPSVPAPDVVVSMITEVAESPYSTSNVTYTLWPSPSDMATIRPQHMTIPYHTSPKHQFSLPCRYNEYISKLLRARDQSWPQPAECQHFRRLNLRAFYSTWLAVTAKNIKIEDHIDFSLPLPSEAMLPECPQDFPPSLHTMDHLDGMKRRGSLDYAAEQGLREVLHTIHGDPISTKDAGTRIALALKTNRGSWVVSNMAALYWRVEGSASRALDCLRHALHYSPNNWKDIALISTANVYHRAGLLDDGITVAKMAVDIAPSLVINHFTLANLYSAKGLFDKAIDLYQSSLSLQPEFQPAKERLRTIQCNILQLTDQEGDYPGSTED